MSAFLDLIYPRACLACDGQVLGKEGHVCWDCMSALDLISDPFCWLCGDPVEGKVERRYTCSSCTRQVPHFDGARSAVRYRDKLPALLQAFKYAQATSLSRDLADLLAGCVRAHFADVSFDAVLAVPLHPRKERSRSYNQSALLADDLSRLLHLSRAHDCIVRQRSTKTQTGLSARKRRNNVKGAFWVNKSEWVEGRRLLLVDDVMTTGATVGECSRVLKEAGVAGVWVVTVARG